MTITGEIKNRDFYPHIDELMLALPFFKEGKTTYTCPIDNDNRLSFSFRIHADMCEVSIKPYIEHLYVQPGDSIHLNIDFKDMLHPVITGSGRELNEQMARYTEGGYYMRDYHFWGEYHSPVEFDQRLKAEYQERIRRYEEFVQQHQPTDEVRRYISETLKADYHKAQFAYLSYNHITRMEGFDLNRYADSLKEAARLFETSTITEAHFRLAEEMYNYLRATHPRAAANAPDVTLEEMLSPLQGTPAVPYLYARGVAASLYASNDTTLFDGQKENFDRYIQSPYLRSTILQLQQSKKGFQENPKPVSDYLLYGKYPDEVKGGEALPYMKPFYELLDKHRGKMIYLDFWGPYCPPCLKELEPLKELRRKYATEDIVFLSICQSNDRKTYEQVLDKYEMHVPGIEHIYANDLQDKYELHKMFNQLNIEAFPYFFLINREGVIVNYGTLMRPSDAGTAECIDKFIQGHVSN